MDHAAIDQMFAELSGEQSRQLVNAEQVFDAYRAARSILRTRFVGSMAWKTVGGRAYLYRARGGVWKSLGPRSPETEALHRRFTKGRILARLRTNALAQRMNRVAAVSRAQDLGRIPVIAARILRALAEAELGAPVIAVVGTNALFAYERMAGINIAESELETADLDRLYDARASLRLLATDVVTAGIAGLLRKVDRSFEILSAGSFRAANRDGYLVDLITPAARDPICTPPPRPIGSTPDDLVPVEIAGLAWLVNSPKVTQTVIDLRGYPVSMTVPDPRVYALHKAWLATREDRHPGKRRRDGAQAYLVAALIDRYMPHLRFDDTALNALPAALRALAPTLIPERGKVAEGGSLEPDW